MSLKTDLEMVKDELTSEEKFFEKAVVTEKFVKKYKKVIIGGVIIIALFIATNTAYSAYKQNTIDAANEALSELQRDANNPAISAKLKGLSPVLHDVWVYSQAVANKDTAKLETLKNSKALLIGDLASYEIAQSTQDLTKLAAYAKQPNALYADLARIESAIILIKEKKLKESHELLSMINGNSPLAKVAQTLMHYGVK